MNNFEKYLKKYLQDYSSFSVLRKVNPIFRAFNLNDRNHLSEHLHWLQLIILKYSFLYGNDRIPKQNEEFPENKINRLKHKLRKCDDKFDKKSRMRPILDLGVLKPRQMAASQTLFQINIAEYYREFYRVAEIFLTDWEQKEKVSKYLDDNYGFTLKEYFLIFLSLIAMLEKSYKTHPDLHYSIPYLRDFNENEIFRNLKPEALRESARKKIFEIISKSPSQAKECISKEFVNPIPGKEKFYDTSIFEKEIPLIKVQEGVHIPVAPHVLVRASYWFLFTFLRKNLGLSKLNNEDGYAFSTAVEKHLLRVARLANSHNLKILDGSQIEKELNIKEELSPDLLIESEEQIFLFESKAITFGTEIKFTLNPQKFIEQCEKRNLIHAVAQLISAYKVLKSNTVKNSKEVFMFVVTLDELYIPNWKTFYKAFLKDIQLNNYSFGEETKKEIKSVLGLQKELNLENIFFISVHWYNKFIQVLNSGDGNFNSICNEIER